MSTSQECALHRDSQMAGCVVPLGQRPQVKETWILKIHKENTPQWFLSAQFPSVYLIFIFLFAIFYYLERLGVDTCKNTSLEIVNTRNPGETHLTTSKQHVFHVCYSSFDFLKHIFAQYESSHSKLSFFLLFHF